MFRNFLIQLFGPTSQFQIGQAVEVAEGGVLMIIESIKPGHGAQSIIGCSYYDQASGTMQTKEFLEEELKPIDWVHPAKGGE